MPLNGLLWCDVPGRGGYVPAVVGLVVRDGRVVDGPPYARKARGGRPAWVCPQPRGAAAVVGDLLALTARVQWLKDGATVWRPVTRLKSTPPG